MFTRTRVFCSIIIISLMLVAVRGLASNGAEVKLPSLQGRVLTPEGTPFIPGPGISVELCLKTVDPDAGDDRLSKAQADGSYCFEGEIPTGDYRIYTDVTGVGLYSGGLPVNIHLESGHVLSQDLTLVYPSITGRVFTPDGNIFVPGKGFSVRIQLRTAGKNERDLLDTELNPDGSFRLGGSLPAGDYSLRASVGGDNNPFTDSISQVFHLEAGTVVIQDLSLTRPAIRGAVLGPGGAIFTPTDDCWVEVALRAVGPGSEEKEVSRTRIGKDGSFKLGGSIPAGLYKLCGSIRGGNVTYSDPLPLEISYQAAEFPVQFLSLTNPLLRGRVLNPDGSPFVPGRDSRVEVHLKSAGPDPKEIVVKPNNDGSFLWGGIISDGEFLVWAVAGGSNNPYTDSSSRSVRFVKGTTMVQDLRLTNPIISGKVMVPEGTLFVPRPEAWVDLSLRMKGGDETEVTAAKVNSDGSYRLGGPIQTGDYRLLVYARGKENGYTDPVPLNLQVIEGRSLVQDIKLLNPQLKGRVLKPDGKPFAPDEMVDADLRIQASWDHGTEPLTEIIFRDGAYRLGGTLSAGVYRIWAAVRGVNNPYTDSIPMLFQIKADTTMVQDIRLTNPLVKGRLLEPGGAVYQPGEKAGVRVLLTDSVLEKKLVAGVMVYSDGTFKIGGEIPDGRYQLRTDFSQSNIPCPYAEPDPVTVELKEGTLLIQDLRFSNLVVSGKVYTPGDAVFIPEEESMVEICLRPLAASWGKGVVSRAEAGRDGSYKVGGDLPDGDYLLQALVKGNNNPYANALPVAVNVKAGKTVAQDLSLLSPSVIGSILNPDGSDFTPPPGEPGITIAVRNLYSDGEGEDFTWAQVKGNGTFRLGGIVLSGKYKLEAYVENPAIPYCDAIPIAVNVNKGKPITQNLTLTLPLIVGKILTPGGRTFLPEQGKQAKICLKTASDHKTVIEKSIYPDGSFKLGEGLKPGDYLLYTYADGINNPFTDALPLKVHLEVGVTLTREIKLTAPIVTGKVLTPDGKRFIPGEGSEAGVFLRTPDGQDVGKSKVNQEGFFSLGGDIPSGEYTLFVSARGDNNPYSNSISILISVKAGIPQAQDISLTRPSVVGRILAPDGTPYLPIPYGEAGYFVYITGLKDLKTCVAWAGDNKDGSFKLGGAIPTGDYLLYGLVIGSNNPYANSTPVTIHVREGFTKNQDIIFNNPVLAGSLSTSDGNAFIPGPDCWACIAVLTEPKLAPAEWEELYNIIYRLEHFMKSNWYHKTGFAIVNKDGTFRLGGNIPAGDYKLCVYTGGTGHRFDKGTPENVYLESGAKTIIRNIRLLPINRPPALNPIASKTVDEGQTLQFAVSASDPDGDVLVYQADNLPGGATFDTETGIFRWTPGYTQAGKYLGVSFGVSDGKLTDSEDTVITVNQVSAGDMIGKLVKKLEGLGLRAETGDTLFAHLNKAFSAAENGQDDEAIAGLNEFIGETKALVDQQIMDGRADDLVKDAQKIIGVISARKKSIDN
jgi:hypothetical protein